MRLPPTPTAGVTAAAALVLLSACGADAEGSNSQVDAFCSASQQVFSDLNTAFDNASDPTQLPGLLQQATSALQSIDPPAEIEASWTSFSGALGQLARSAQALDLSTTEGQGQLTQQYDSLMAGTTAAQDEVDQFVAAHCQGATGSPSS